jgi:CubicO group peptidase (beta-lactamase class C family)
VHRLILALAVVAAAVAGFAQRTSAQALTFTLFERYLDSLREQAGIPGMSVWVSQNGTELWSAGLGRADIEANLRPTPDTPYLIGDLSQTIGATLLLKECIDESYAELNDRVDEWVPGFAAGSPSERDTTLAMLLAHIAPTGVFRYDLGRFAWLTPVIENCSDNPYSPLLHEQVFHHLLMNNSVPGTAIVTPTPTELRQFEQKDVSRFAVVLSQMATPYHVDRGRHVRTELARVGINAANGVVTTVRDFSKFDATLDHVEDRGLVEPKTLERAWTTLGSGRPAGLGWFLQGYNQELVVWQFGVVPRAYSALVVKVPNRGLTFILFANSDALAAPFSREIWDVTASAFAKLFLVTFVP